MTQAYVFFFLKTKVLKLYFLLLLIFVVFYLSCHLNWW